VIRKVAQKYKVPLRGSGLCHIENSVKYYFTAEFYDQGVSLEGIMKHLLSLKAQYDVVEVMCHPAEADQSLLSKSSYAQQREVELQVLTSPVFKQELAQHGMAITDYSALVSSSGVASV
jgi:predicted glycoside hydrolase/deacetylase ChbG (UPF0249 family)